MKNMKSKLALFALVAGIACAPMTGVAKAPNIREKILFWLMMKIERKQIECKRKTNIVRKAACKMKVGLLNAALNTIQNIKISPEDIEEIEKFSKRMKVGRG